MTKIKLLKNKSSGEIIAVRVSSIKTLSKQNVERQASGTTKIIFGKKPTGKKEFAFRIGSRFKVIK
jgi:hypothetical protein|tara:strand:+ start:271 stop:468 length:198 start_codon:yes stop_codon:yes gene_type:complete